MDKKEKGIDCSDSLKNKVIILNITENGQIVANLYDLSPPPPPAPPVPEPVEAKPAPENPEPGTVVLNIDFPKDKKPGDTITTTLNSMPVTLKIPADAKPGEKIKFVIPPPPGAKPGDPKAKPPEPPPVFDPKVELQKVLKTIMNDQTNPQWIPRVFKFVNKIDNTKKYNVMLEEQSILELIAGFTSGNNAPRKLSRLGCSGLEASNHTDVLAYVLGFPIVHPDKEREQLIGDIIKLINPIQAIDPEYKDLKFLQGQSRNTLQHIKQLADKLLLFSTKKVQFQALITDINQTLATKLKAKKGGSGRRTRRK